MVPLVIFQITGSGALSGLAFFIETLPRFLAFPIAGILCDLISPYKIVSVSQRLRALIIPLGLIGFYSYDSVYWLMGIAALVGVATSFALMAREMMLVQDFTHMRFEKVLSFSSLADQLGMVLGPILASALLLLFSWQVSLALCMSLFMLSDMSLHYWRRLVSARLNLEENEPINTGQLTPTSWRFSALCTFFYRQIKLAFVQIFALPKLLPIILLAFCINLILGMTLATMAPIYTGLFAQSESSYALLQTLGVATSIGILALLARFTLPLNGMGVTAFLAMCVGTFMTALSEHYLIYLIGFLLIIGFDKMFNIFLRSLRKKLIPRENLGKSTGVLVLLNNIAQPIAGLIVALFATQFLLQNLLLYTALLVSVLATVIGAFYILRSK